MKKLFDKEILHFEKKFGEKILLKILVKVLLDIIIRFGIISRAQIKEKIKFEIEQFKNENK